MSWPACLLRREGGLRRTAYCSEIFFSSMDLKEVVRQVGASVYLSCMQKAGEV